MVTTVKLHRNTKEALDFLKVDGESYDGALKRILSPLKDKEKKKQLIESYKQMGKEELEILHEWESTSGEIDD